MRLLGVNVFGLILFRVCLASFIWDFIQFAIVGSSPPLFLQIPFQLLSWDYDTNDDYFGISVAQSRIIVDHLLFYLLKCWSISWFLHCCYRNFQYNFYLVLFYKCYCFTLLSLLSRDTNLGHFRQFFFLPNTCHYFPLGTQITKILRSWIVPQFNDAWMTFSNFSLCVSFWMVSIAVSSSSLILNFTIDRETF